MSIFCKDLVTIHLHLQWTFQSMWWNNAFLNQS